MGNLLYKSKGISKKGIIIGVVSILLSLIISFTLLALTELKVEGPKQVISIGGKNILTSLEQDRFSDDTQEAFLVLSRVILVLVFAEAILLVGHCISWTEIYEDRIQANYMGKTISYSVANMVSVTNTGNRIKIEGSAGNISIIVKEPQKAVSIIHSLLLR